MTSSVWDNIVQQPKAVERLRQLALNHAHAFLFISPDGCGNEDAARAFASHLITELYDASSREANLIMRGSFSDVIEVLGEGAVADWNEANPIIRLSNTTPTL